MFRSYRVGRLFGFPIDVNLSFLLLLAVVLIWMGGLTGVFAMLIAFASVLLHELGHALVARRLGVAVSSIELYFFGGAAKMIEQPKTAGDEIAIAAAGPAVSFALGGVFLVLSALSGVALFQTIAWINLIIGAFNLVPALPMDGGRIFRGALSYKFGFRRATELAIYVSRGFSIFLGIVGLATLQLYLIALAVVVWFMGSAELAVSNRFGYRGDAPQVEVMPNGIPFPFSGLGRGVGTRTPGPPSDRGASSGHWIDVQRPRPVGGFIIRQRGGRLYVEPMV